MLQTNARKIKLAAARAEFGRRGMLQDDVYTHTLLSLGEDVDFTKTQAAPLDQRFRDELDAVSADRDRAEASVELAQRASESILFRLLGCAEYSTF